MKKILRFALGLPVRLILLGILAALNILHPFIHVIEGGSLDAILPYMDMMVLHMQTYDEDK